MPPQLDHTSLHVLQAAIEALGVHRGIPCPLTDPRHGIVDPAHALHLLHTLTLQAHHYLPDLLAAAYDHRDTRRELHDLLGHTPTILTTTMETP